MARLGEGEDLKKSDLRDFSTINRMREELEMPILIKSWVECIGGCGDEFFSYDARGNRICENCKSKPKNHIHQDFTDAYSVVGA